MVALGIGLGPEFGDHRAVHGHAAFEDQLLGVAAAGDAGVGQQLLQTFFCHLFGHGRFGPLGGCFVGGSRYIGGWLGSRLLIAHRQPAQLLKLLQRRQLAQILQAELHQEFLGGLVQDRLAEHRLPAGGGDQLAIDQRL